jgi:MYXO-CTERM domain-containing protein
VHLRCGILAFVVSFSFFGGEKIVLAAPATAPRILSRYEMEVSDPTSMAKIGRRFSIEGRKGNTVTVYVHQDEAESFRQLAPGARLVAADNDAWMRDLTRADRAGYLTYDQWVEKFNEYEKQYPDIVKMVTPDYMKSSKGKPIIVMKLSGNVEVDNAKKPVLAFSGSTHGDEWSSTAAGMGVLDEMLAAYGNDMKITKMIDWTTTYWIPIISPDSFQISREVDGVDPNRVYPYPDEPDLDGEVPHAQAVLKFYREIKPVASIDFHAVVGANLWPWGYTTNQVDPEDYAEFQSVGKMMVASSGYDSYQASQLYPAPGSDDSWYHQFHTLSFTIEMGGDSKKPSESALPGLTEDARGGIYALMEYKLPTEDPNEGDDTGEDSSDTSDDGESSDEMTDTGDGDASDETTTGSSDEDDDEDDDDDDGDSETDATDEATETSHTDESTDGDGSGDDDDDHTSGGDDDDDASDEDEESGDSAAADGKESGCRISDSTPWSLGALALLGLPLIRRRRARA